jgi:hypothetical protein
VLSHGREQERVFQQLITYDLAGNEEEACCGLRTTGALFQPSTGTGEFRSMGQSLAEKVPKREGYLCLFCPAYHSSPVFRLWHGYCVVPTRLPYAFKIGLLTTHCHVQVVCVHLRLRGWMSLEKGNALTWTIIKIVFGRTLEMVPTQKCMWALDEKIRLITFS